MWQLRMVLQRNQIFHFTCIWAHAGIKVLTACDTISSQQPSFQDCQMRIRACLLAVWGILIYQIKAIMIECLEISPPGHFK